MIRRWFPWRRCRFCRDWQRGPHAQECRRLDGVCRACLDETLTWLALLGCVVTTPRELAAWLKGR